MRGEAMGGVCVCVLCKEGVRLHWHGGCVTLNTPRTSRVAAGAVSVVQQSQQPEHHDHHQLLLTHAPPPFFFRFLLPLLLGPPPA
jgi:hypothetical protein